MHRSNSSGFSLCANETQWQAKPWHDSAPLPLTVDRRRDVSLMSTGTQDHNSFNCNQNEHGAFNGVRTEGGGSGGEGVVTEVTVS
jgi:hypothetical protein